jgi:hypothetical protein
MALGAMAVTHAFIVGINGYPHLPKVAGNGQKTPLNLGLRQPASAVADATAFYRWLATEYRNPSAPLATCRVLISPAEEDYLLDQAFDRQIEPATVTNFLREAGEWRRDAETNRHNVMIFFFAGCAVQVTKLQSILVLHDFGDGIGGRLRHAVDVASLIGGLTPSTSRPDIARTQLFFIDGRRAPPESFSYFESTGTTSAFDLELPGLDDRNNPMFYASLAASADSYRRVSSFGAALLKCMNGDAASRVGENDDDVSWAVTTASLFQTLPRLLDETNRAQLEDWTLSIGGGSFQDTPIHYLAEAPLVDVQLSLPTQLSRPGLIVKVTDQSGETVLDLPYEAASAQKHRLRAGIYDVQVSAPGARSTTTIKMATPPASTWKVALRE